MFEYLRDSGIDDLTAWVGRLLYENSQVYYDETIPGVAFIRIETVKLLYDIMDVNLLIDISLQDFFNILQHSAEEK